MKSNSVSISSEKLLAAIQGRYGDSRESPDFSFAEHEYRAQRYSELICSLLRRYDVRDLTDLNDDVSHQIRLRGTNSEYLLSLSLVGRFAIVCPVDGVDGRIQPPLSLCSGRLSVWDKKLLELVRKANVILLPQEQVEERIEMRLFDTEPENVRLYQVLFSDRDLLPWAKSED